jgi:protein-tyrosine phosphatase
MKVLFVCLGNICRSPTAEGVLRKLVAEASLDGQVEIDSAGTLGFHAGQPPDPRSIEHAMRRGVDLSSLRAREIVLADFERFDYVLAMDLDNLRQLKARCPGHLSQKIKLLLDYSAIGGTREVPDPYHGEAKDFELTLELIEAGCKGLTQHLTDQLRGSLAYPLGLGG